MDTLKSTWKMIYISLRLILRHILTVVGQQYERSACRAQRMTKNSMQIWVAYAKCVNQPAHTQVEIEDLL
jgi:hypothetical protein